MLDPSIRWTDRLQSSSGEWSGNLCDFYFRVYNKLQKDIKIPFETRGGDRIDDTPVHKAIREALANCLINADFFGKYGVVIKKEADTLTLENPGYIRVGKKQMLRGGLSDPRNKALMKMFNMINVGERAGSGVPNILQTWSNEEWIEPVIDEQFNPGRTILKLSFVKKYSLGGEDLTQRPTQVTQGTKETQTVYSLPEFDLAIISLMKKDPTISQTAMAASLNANINTLKYHVLKLREKGIIYREGSSQKGQWIVKL